MNLLRLVAVSALVSTPSLPAQQTSTHFINGQWFNGTSFAADDFYAVNGLLTHTPPPHLDATVDLHHLYLIPPFGDAHEHMFSSTRSIAQETADYLRDGIFYAQGMTDPVNRSKEVAALVNTPTTVDVTYAHGGLTATNGHPKDVYELFRLGIYTGYTPEQEQKAIASSLDEGLSYWSIDTPADLDAKWPRILATRPDLIKVYLSGSEHFSPSSPAHTHLGGGLDPALIPLITARAHASHLKVAAHVDTASDFHAALLGNVDEMAHLPGYCIVETDDPTHYRLSDADIALAAIHNVTTIATASVCDNDRASAKTRSITRASQLDNFARLKAAGVPILIGSDSYGTDSVHEATYLRSLGLWTNLELLRIWSTATPQDIFPRRRLGELKPGYEASFLVLPTDPLADWSATAHITQRWKQGAALNPPPPSTRP